MNDSSAAAARRTLARTIDDSSATSQVALLRGIREMLRCDQAEVVQHIAAYVVSQHPGLRLLDFLVERGPGEIMTIVLALIGFLRAFISVSAPEGDDGYAWIARLSNERRAIENLRDLNPNSWSELKFGVVPDISTVRALCGSFAPRRLGKLIRRLHRQHKFYKVLRVVELIAYYSRYLEIFRSSHFVIAVTSNHSNPHGLAFNLAARKSGLPVMLIAHGMPVRPVARLSYELAIAHSEAARETYLDEGCCWQHVLVHGRRDVYSPMPQQLPQRLTVGVFLCKEVNEVRVAELVR